MLALTLIDGVQRTFQNADALFSEARLLAGVGAVARAYFLHQISLEECGKIEILSAAVTRLLMGDGRHEAIDEGFHPPREQEQDECVLHAQV